MAASRGSAPSRRHAKQPKNLRNTPRSCSSAGTQQSRGVKRNHLLAPSSAAQTSTNTPPNWGEKRARSVLRRCGPASCSGNSGCARGRDWASLGWDGPASLIAELALASDVADCVRFRAVCRPWRQCSPDARGAQGDGSLDLDCRLFPRQWIMLDNAHDAVRRHRFLNVSTGECIRTDLPELGDHTLLAVTPEGLLLLLHEPSLVVRLLNPLTRQLTDLPAVTALLTEEQRARRSRGDFRDSLSVSGVGLADDAFTVAVCFHYPTVLAVAKPGDERWTLVSNSNRYMDSALPFAGRFHCAIGSTIVVLKDLGSAQPRLVTVVERSRSLRFCRMADTFHLLDNAGEMMMVCRTPRMDKDERHKMEYIVYRVDLDAGALVPAKDLNGRAVFMGRRRAISVPPAPAGSFSCLAADTLYPGSDCTEKTRMNRIEGYNVADRSSQPCYHDDPCNHDDWCDEMVQPCSIVDCISHCIQGNGAHLA